MRIVFLGTGEIGVPSLQALAELSSHQVCAVFTQPDRPAGRNLRLRSSPVKQAAGRLGIPVFQPEKIRDPEAIGELQALRPDVIVVIAYGQILPRAILELPPFGCLNVHASLLPRHRGASPINAAILAGDSVSGVTIIQMDVGLDTGDMLAKSETPILDTDTAGALHDRLAQLAPAALLHVLDQIGSHVASPEKQDEALATYAPKLSRQDGEIVWTESAALIDRQIRGLAPWPGTFTYMPGHTLLKIHQAIPRDADPASPGVPGTVLSTTEQGILIATGQGSILLQQVQVAGGRRLSAADFVRGHSLPIGTNLG